MLHDVIDIHQKLSPVLIDHFPKLKHTFHSIASQERIANYLKSTKRLSTPTNSVMAKFDNTVPTN